MASKYLNLLPMFLFAMMAGFTILQHCVPGMSCLERGHAVPDDLLFRSAPLPYKQREDHIQNNRKPSEMDSATSAGNHLFKYKPFGKIICDRGDVCTNLMNHLDFVQCKYIMPVQKKKQHKSLWRCKVTLLENTPSKYCFVNPEIQCTKKHESSTCELTVDAWSCAKPQSHATMNGMTFALGEMKESDDMTSADTPSSAHENDGSVDNRKGRDQGPVYRLMAAIYAFTGLIVLLLLTAGLICCAWTLRSRHKSQDEASLLDTSTQSSYSTI